MTLQCDWCHRPIYGSGKKGWGFQVEFVSFHSLDLGRKSPATDRPNNVVLEAHVHPKPCRDELGWAIGHLLEDREPLATDGPADEADSGDTPRLHVVTDESSDRDERQDEERRRKAAHWRAWTKLPWEGKERLCLQALGDDRLTVMETYERMRDQLADEYLFHDGQIRSLLTRMLHTRQLERRGEPRVPGGKALRYRYFRRRRLEGPIVDLERTFNETDDEAS